MNRAAVALLICWTAWAFASRGETAENAPLTRPDFARFSREAAWAMSGVARTNLAPVYPYLAEFIVQKYCLTNQSGIGVDIGGGPGSLVMELSRRAPGFYWINTDINTFHAEAFFRNALTNDCAGRVGLVFADVHHLPFRDGYADLVVSRGSMPFWADPQAALAEIYRVLKPGGNAFIGRGFSPNLPLEVARQVRANQGDKVPKYEAGDAMEQLRGHLRALGIKEFEIIRPRTDQTEVNYGVWAHFRKPGGN